MLYLDEFVAEELGAEATIGTECPYLYPELRAGWWLGQKLRSETLRQPGAPNNNERVH